jgi:hypothetical protein
MANWTESQIKKMLAQARLLGCTKYTRSGGKNGGIYLLDHKNELKAFAIPGRKLWTWKDEHAGHKISVGLKNLADLRKRYEHKHNSGTSEGKD